MINSPTALVVGATSRNCGKTTFICALTERFRSFLPVAVKVKTIYPGDEHWHGKGRPLEQGFIIREEKLLDGMDDSIRMLRSGANQVFYIKSFHAELTSAIQQFFRLIPNDVPVIFESNSVMEIINPAAFLMIEEHDRANFKPSAQRLIHKANLVIKTNGESHMPSPSELDIVWRSNIGFKVNSVYPED